MNYYVKVQPNVRIFVEDLNKEAEQTILFIHGWPLNHHMWEYEVERLQDLGFRCVAIDLRGYGQSDRPTTGYDYDTMASDVKGVIDALQLSEIILVGHSMGGAIATHYVSKFNAHGISKLVLLGAAVPAWVKTNDWDHGYTKEQVNDFIAQSVNDRPKFIHSVRNLFFYQYATPETGVWFTDLCQKAAGWSTAKSLVALRDEQLFNDLPNIQIPTLILHGTHDQVCPFEFAEYMHQHITNSKLTPLTESGHAAFFEEKDKVSKAIAEFAKS